MGVAASSYLVKENYSKAASFSTSALELCES